MTNDIMKTESKFYANLGNGQKAGEYLQDMVKSVTVSRDTTVIVKAIQRAEAKGDKAAASVVRFVFGQVFPSAKVTKSKAGDLSLKIKGIEHDDKALERLAEAVSKGLSIRHSTFRKTVQGEQAQAEFDLQKYAKTIASRLKREGQSLDAVIAALQAVRSEA